jgi:phosphatidylglycerol:prolipoprotein diacylglycerol transferase
MSFPYLSDVLNAVLGTDLFVPVPMFGLIVVLAIGVASLVAISNIRREESRGNLPPSSHAIVGDLALVTGLSGILGARVFHIVDHLEIFLADPASMIFSRSGFSIYGGLLFGLVAGILFLRRRGFAVRRMLDAVAPSLMLGYGIGRLGCQLAGDGDWGGVYPTPLYEFIGAGLLFGVLWLLRSHRHRPGHLFSVYLLLAGFERLLIEKIRVNLKHDVFGYSLTQAELSSILAIVAGLVGILVTLKTRAIWVRALISLGVLSALSACVLDGGL